MCSYPSVLRLAIHPTSVIDPSACSLVYGSAVHDKLFPGTSVYQHVVPELIEHRPPVPDSASHQAIQRLVPLDRCATSTLDLIEMKLYSLKTICYDIP